MFGVMLGVGVILAVSITNLGTMGLDLRRLYRRPPPTSW